MGYSKANRNTQLRIHVKYPALNEEYFFTVPRARKMDKDKKEQLLAIANNDIDIVQWAAETIILPPEGFDDFPMTAAEKEFQASGGILHSAADYVEPITEPLPSRIQSYFNDPACPELKDILWDVWASYYNATTPNVFFPSSASSVATSPST